MQLSANSTWKEKWTRFAVLLLISVVFMSYMALQLISCETLHELQQQYVRLFCLAAVAGVAFVGLLCWLAQHKKLSTQQFFLLTFVVLSLGYMVLFAPVTVPDEQVHYISSYRMSNFFLFHWSQSGADGVIMRQADADFFGAFSSSGTLDESKFIAVVQNRALIAGDTHLVLYGASASTSVPLGYVASAIGIAIGRLLHLGALPVFYLGRMFNMAEFAAMVYVAVKRTPVAKSAFCMLALFPMTLHLVASYSYDGMIIGVCMLLVSELLRMIYGEQIKWRQLIYCAILCAVLAPSKLVYIPLVCLVLLVPNEKLKPLVKYPWLLKAGLVCVGVVSLLVVQLGAMSSYVGDGSTGSYIAWAEEEGYTLSWVLAHPARTVVLYLNTLVQKADYYLSTMLGSSLGWFQLSVPMYLYLPFGVMFLVGCLKKKGEPERLGWLSKCWTFLMIAGSAALILTSMFLSWTPISSTIFQGVQGRYFLPLLPAVILLVRNDSVVLEESDGCGIMTLAGALNVYVLAYCFIECLGAL